MIEVLNKLIFFRFTQIPTSELVNIKTLKKLDLGYNRLTTFDPELTDQIKLGLEVEYEGKKKSCRSSNKTRDYFQFLIGNPLTCDCQLRPVSYWLASIGRVQGKSGPWDRVICAGEIITFFPKNIIFSI